MEQQASRNVIAYCRQHFPAVEIKHDESTVDMGKLPKKPRDHYLWAYVAAAVMASEENLTKLILPRGANDFTNPADAQLSTDSYMTAIRVSTKERGVEICYPMLHMDKGQVIRALPADLRKLCWWCRRPRRRNGQWRVCHRCHTCKAVDPVLKEMHE